MQDMKWKRETENSVYIAGVVCQPGLLCSRAALTFGEDQPSTKATQNTGEQNGWDCGQPVTCAATLASHALHKMLPTHATYTATPASDSQTAQMKKQGTQGVHIYMYKMSLAD